MVLVSAGTLFTPVAAFGDSASSASPCAPSPSPETPEPAPEPETPEPALEPVPDLVYVAGRCITTSELNGLLDGYESAVAEETVALAQLRDTVGAARELQQAVLATELSVAQVTQRLAAAEAEAIRAEARERLAREELAAVTDRLAEEQETLREQSVAAYVTGTAARAAVQDRMIDLESANDFATIRAYGRVLVETQGDQVDLVALLQLAARSLETELVEARQNAGEARSTLVDVETTAEEIRHELTGLVEEANAAAAEQGTLLVSIQMRRDDFAARLGVVPPPAGRLAAVLSASRVGAASTGFGARLSSPLPDAFVASAFGPRLHPIFNEVRPHTGIDLNAGAGEPIFAAAAGEVVVAGDEGGYGRTVAIDHGGGLITLYAHQSVVAVAVSDMVEAGDLIGYVGSTGYSTGPHLHFEVRIDGRPVDPLPLVDLSHVGQPVAVESTASRDD